MNQNDLRNNLLDSGHWLRILFMLCFSFAVWVVGVLLAVLVLVQLLITLVAGSPNFNLQKTGYQFVLYLRQILQFLLYNSEEKPFPLADFPSAEGFEPPQRQRKPAPEANAAAAAGTSTAGTVPQQGTPEPQAHAETEARVEPGVHVAPEVHAEPEVHTEPEVHAAAEPAPATQSQSEADAGTQGQAASPRTQPSGPTDNVAGADSDQERRP